MTARQVKESNPVLLSNVSLSLVQRNIHHTLDFSYHTALKKPILTTRQKANRLTFAIEKLSWHNNKWKIYYGVMRQHLMLLVIDLAKYICILAQMCVTQSTPVEQLNTPIVSWYGDVLATMALGS